MDRDDFGNTFENRCPNARVWPWGPKHVYHILFFFFLGIPFCAGDMTQIKGRSLTESEGAVVALNLEKYLHLSLFLIEPVLSKKPKSIKVRKDSKETKKNASQNPQSQMHN